MKMNMPELTEHACMIDDGVIFFLNLFVFNPTIEIGLVYKGWTVGRARKMIKYQTWLVLYCSIEMNPSELVG